MVALLVAILFSVQHTAARADDALIRDFHDLTGVHAGADVHLSIDTEATFSDGPVLTVVYPQPGSDPAARDVRIDATQTDWTHGREILFRVKPEHAVRLSVSFLDRNHVVYTAYVDLKGGEWQPVRIALDSIKPNQFFQPPDAKTNAPMDVSDVKFIAFAPQDKTAGRLSIFRFVLLQ